MGREAGLILAILQQGIDASQTLQHAFERLAAIQEYLPSLCRIVSAASDGFTADRLRRPSWTTMRFISANARLVSAIAITPNDYCMNR